MPDTNHEHRSEVSRAQRQLIRETVAIVHEQTYQKLVAEPITQRLLDNHEPHVVRDTDITYPNLITRPRDWVKEILTTLAKAHFVTVSRVRVRGKVKLRLVGKAHDVQIAERSIQRFLMLTRNYADAAYKGGDEIIPGSRKRYLEAVVAFEQAALWFAYEPLAREFGYERLDALVGGLDHVRLPETLDDVRRLARPKRLARAS